MALIYRFLSKCIPSDEPQQPRRKLTAADATTDYVAYLLQMEDALPDETPSENENTQSQRSNALINDFIENKTDRLVLTTPTEDIPDPIEEPQTNANEEDYFTETQAKIYKKQERYEKALEIITKLSMNYPKKSRYFADQLRFLQKLIINNKHNKQEKNV